uniref:Uncharacterized protein n=1 Tax=Kalanchoe fedtschenkoi TaxID=63787 RepID=A0A7N0TZ56_KALFE
MTSAFGKLCIRPYVPRKEDRGELSRANPLVLSTVKRRCRSFHHVARFYSLVTKHASINT